MAYADGAVVSRTRRCRDRVVIDGTDVTYFRDVECEVSYELTEPYGYGPGQLTFPQITMHEEGLFGDPGDLAWVRDGAVVRVDRVMPGEGVVVKGIYRGRVFTKRPTNNGLTLELAGHASGPLSQRWRPQPLVRKTQDAGRLIARAFLETPGVKMNPWRGVVMGVDLDNGEGGITQLGWVDSCLELAYDGDPWSVMPMPNKSHTYEIRRKDLDTVHYTVWMDAFGVTVDVVDDVTEKPNAGYGSGINNEGEMWVNGKWPDLGPEQVPPFPGVLQEGDSGEDVTVLKLELVSGGLLRADALGDETYNAKVTEAVETVQELAGLPVTGILDSATWDAVWGDDVSNQRAGSGEIFPLVVRPEVERWLYTANGSVMARNPDYDETVLRVDRDIPFGTGVSKQTGRKWWRKEIRRANGGPNYYGTITLDTDVWEGEHSLESAGGTVVEKEQIVAGTNILLRKYGRDILFHIASVRRSGTSVVLTVDTKGRDYIHIGEMIQRDQEARRDYSRNWRAVHKNSRQAHDAITGWYAEDGAGRIRQRVRCPGNSWTVFPVIGGQAGQVMRTTLATTEAPAAFVMAVAGAKFPAEGLAARVPDPFALNEDDEPAWNDGEIQEWLHEEKRFAYIIGDANQPGGYWPKKHTNRRGEVTDHPITGVHKDWMTWPYTTYGGPILWVAIYPDRDTVLKPQELFRASRVLGGH